MKTAALPLLAALVALPLITGCATWYSRTPDGIRHTRMMVHSGQTYFYPVDPVTQPVESSYQYRETPLEWLSRVLNIPAR